MGTEIRTFTSIKDLTEYLVSQSVQYKALYEDYSQWLGTLLRDLEGTHKSDEWFQKSTTLQKNLKAVSKKPPESSEKGKKGGKGKEGKSFH